MSKSAFNIRTKTGRDKLLPRNEPYFEATQQGQALGYRKISIDPHHGTWIARLTINRKKHYHKLTNIGTDRNPHTKALKEANKWFTMFLSGINTEYTLLNATEDYIKYTEGKRTQKATRLVKGHFKTIPENLLSLPLYKVTTVQLRDWRDSHLIHPPPTEPDAEESIRKNKNTTNRRWSDMNACLNMAFKNDHVDNDAVWRKITPFKGVHKGRDIFFTKDELHSIMEQSRDIGHGDDLHRLCKAGALTGFRIGELRNIQVKDFDTHHECVNITQSKTGARVAYLSEGSLQLFKDCCTSNGVPKEPDDFIFDYHGKQWKVDYHVELFNRITDLPKGSCFYCLRHYYASVALSIPNVTTDMVAKNIGTSVAMIEKFYGKFTSQSQRDTANKIKIDIGT